MISQQLKIEAVRLLRGLVSCS